MNVVVDDLSGPQIARSSTSTSSRCGRSRRFRASTRWGGASRLTAFWHGRGRWGARPVRCWLRTPVVVELLW